MSSSLDEKYLAILMKRIEVCKLYKPRFGQGTGLSLQEFQALYGRDLFYSWFGLDTPQMYAAHKAAGGITSVYRQIGIGSEEIFNQILQDHLSLSVEQAAWAYAVNTGSGKQRVLKLDGRIMLEDVQAEDKRQVIRDWLQNAAAKLDIAVDISNALKGAVFEVRQGFKSKDSKRQNADIANAATAYTQGYLPVVLVLSSQIDSDVAWRYAHEKWLVLRGINGENSTESAYAFTRDVIGFDLAAFFERHSAQLKAMIADVLETLLSSDE
jgi:hypothetical protein